MNILFVTHCTGMAGANRSMLQLIIELRDHYDVTPFVLLPEDNNNHHTLKHYLETQNIFYIETSIRYFKQANKSHKAQKDYICQMLTFRRLVQELKTHKIDIVHSNSSVIDYGGYISRALGCKHVWHLREFGDLDYGLESVMGKNYEKFTYKSGDAFIAISKLIKSHFQDRIPSNKIFIIYNGIKKSENVSIATHLNDKVQFVCAGLLSEGKNQLEILQAIDELVNKRKIKNFHLSLCGLKDDKYVKKLESFSKLHNIDSFWTNLGELNDIYSLLPRMDVGIMCSKCEAFGRVTVEYMLSNLAVIANDSGANPEIIDDNVSGLLYERGNIISLADKMQQLIEDQVKLLTLAENGKKSAENNFLSQYNTSGIYNLYKHVLSQNESFFSHLKKKTNFYCVYSILMLKHLNFKLFGC